ncbi:hypothetical protein YSY43_09260 [Paenibacillus sp. YSY-4.3]
MEPLNRRRRKPRSKERVADPGCSCNRELERELQNEDGIMKRFLCSMAEQLWEK